MTGGMLFFIVGHALGNAGFDGGRQPCRDQNNKQSIQADDSQPIHIFIAIVSILHSDVTHRVRLKVMHTTRGRIENTLGVQGLPCLFAPSQGKPCTPASFLLAPLRTRAESVGGKGPNVNGPLRNISYNCKTNYKMMLRFVL